MVLGRPLPIALFMEWSVSTGPFQDVPQPVLLLFEGLFESRINPRVQYADANAIIGVNPQFRAHWRPYGLPQRGPPGYWTTDSYTEVGGVGCGSFHKSPVDLAPLDIPTFGPLPRWRLAFDSSYGPFAITGSTALRPATYDELPADFCVGV